MSKGRRKTKCPLFACFAKWQEIIHLGVPLATNFCRWPTVPALQMAEGALVLPQWQATGAQSTQPIEAGVLKQLYRTRTLAAASCGE